MTEMLLCVVILLLGCDVALDLAMYRRTRGQEREARRDEAAQEAMDRAERGPRKICRFCGERRKNGAGGYPADSRMEQSGVSYDDDDARRSQAMDEGFDNLMRYSIHEKDGFGGTL